MDLAEVFGEGMANPLPAFLFGKLQGTGRSLESIASWERITLTDRQHSAKKKKSMLFTVVNEHNHTVIQDVNNIEVVCGVTYVTLCAILSISLKIKVIPIMGSILLQTICSSEKLGNDESTIRPRKERKEDSSSTVLYALAYSSSKVSQMHPFPPCALSHAFTHS